LRTLTLIAALLAGAGAALAQKKTELGDYETLALEEALEREGASIDDAPEGKTVAAIRVVNLEVFSRRDGFLQALNRLHVTTRASVIAREVLVRPGETWDAERIAETERNLEIPEYSSLVVIVPVVSPRPGHVDVLVVTRDVWSLRTSSKIEIQNSTLVELLMFPAENNFLGMRKQVSLFFLLDLGSASIGPRYVDPNIAGTHMTFTGFAQAIFNRQNSAFEGHRFDATLEMPFWSLSRRWGGKLRFAKADAIDRTFRDTEVVLHPDPDRPGADPDEARAPREFRLRTVDIAAEGTRSIGTAFINRFTLGYQLSVRRPELLEGFPDDPELAELFAAEVLGRDERLSGPLARYHGFLPRFATYKNVETLDIVEDVRIGPEFILELSPAFELLGSELDLFRTAAQLGWTLDFAGAGYLRAFAGGNLRAGEGGVTGAEVSASAFAALPTIGPAGRVVLSARYDQLIENIDDRVLLAGAQEGLRGYAIGAFAGEARLLLNAELRSPPIAFKALRINGVAFYDVGHAAATASELVPRHNVGVGMRFVFPQDTRFVNRLDWAFPIDGDESVLPGRFSFSFGQFF
jgi:hypothetical protein